MDITVAKDLIESWADWEATWEALTLVAHFHSETLASSTFVAFRGYGCRLNNLCDFYRDPSRLVPAWHAAPESLNLNPVSI